VEGLLADDTEEARLGGHVVARGLVCEGDLLVVEEAIWGVEAFYLEG
jgi:hypothetical protein